MAKQPKVLPVRHQFRQPAVMYASVAALVVLAGVGAFAWNNRSDNLARQSIIEDTIELPETLDGVLGIDEMRTIAEGDAADGATIVGIEIENEHGIVLYKVKYSDGTFRYYDASTGLAFVDVESDESVPADFKPGITLQQARDIASEQRPGKTITKIELEVEEGKVVYSVRFADDGRVDVSAEDGTVLRVRDGDEDNSEDDENENEDDDDRSGSNSGSSDDDEEDDDKSGSSNDDNDNDDEEEEEDENEDESEDD